ncbi:MAG TPA: hypothetical protein VEN99_07885, partial [Acidimicrobiia bacterium]|nr:hypothetical protein [Acidimicrobiia bacterium]
VYMEPRSNAVFALPANQLVGATHAEINSQPRAQGYAATYGVPLAQNARGVGIPIDYHGQCYANYPGEPKVDCGIPFSDKPAPNPPSGGPFGGDAFKAHAEASGSDTAPGDTRASGITEAGGLSAGDAFRIGWSHSESKSYVEGGALHAVTSSIAQDVTIGGVLHIGSVEARAETIHPGALADATGSALTVMQNVTIGGAPVTIGPAGLLVQGQPVGQAPTPAVKPILDQMASHGMTIEPLPVPRVSKDEGTGLIEAATDGFRIELQSPSGDAKFEMVFGRALARAGAVRTADDTPFDLSAGSGQPVAADAGLSLPSPAPPAPTTAEASIGLAAVTRRTAAAPGPGAFTAFDPVSGSVAPTPQSGPGNESTSLSAAPAPRPAPARLTAQPVVLAHDLSSRVLTTYAAIFGVVLAGVVFGLARRPRRFGGSA